VINKGKLLIPLNMLSPGQKAVISEITGGEKVRRRLLDLGLNKGSVIYVIQNNMGPIILALGDTRLVLGFGVAQKVKVEEI